MTGFLYLSTMPRNFLNQLILRPCFQNCLLKTLSSYLFQDGVTFFRIFFTQTIKNGYKYNWLNVFGIFKVLYAKFSTYLNLKIKDQIMFSVESVKPCQQWRFSIRLLNVRTCCTKFWKIHLIPNIAYWILYEHCKFSLSFITNIVFSYFPFDKLSRISNNISH